MYIFNEKCSLWNAIKSCVGCWFWSETLKFCPPGGGGAHHQLHLFWMTAEYTSRRPPALPGSLDLMFAESYGKASLKKRLTVLGRLGVTSTSTLKLVFHRWPQSRGDEVALSAEERVLGFIRACTIKLVAHLSATTPGFWSFLWVYEWEKLLGHHYIKLKRQGASSAKS